MSKIVIAAIAILAIAVVVLIGRRTAKNDKQAFTLAGAKADYSPNLGDVRISVLKPEVFEDMNPDWVLMDGRAIQENWELYQLFKEKGLLDDSEMAVLKNSLPNAKGVFLRGMNYDHTGGDPDTTRAIGSLQEDTFERHDHAVNDMYSHTIRSDNANDRDVGSPQGPSRNIRTGVEGGNETRPKNIALYIYIKVK